MFKKGKIRGAFFAYKKILDAEINGIIVLNKEAKLYLKDNLETYRLMMEESK